MQYFISALGTNVIWGIPFGFLVMLAVWNRYNPSVEEAARDLGANRSQTFREVTLPLVWTGIFGSFLFGFTLTWNDYDRTLLLIAGLETQTLPLRIAGLAFTAAIRPDLYALGTATTLLTFIVILVVLLVLATTRGPSERAQGRARRGGVRRERASRIRHRRDHLPAVKASVAASSRRAARSRHAPEPEADKLVPVSGNEPVELLDGLGARLRARRLAQQNSSSLSRSRSAVRQLGHLALPRRLVDDAS